MMKKTSKRAKSAAKMSKRQSPRKSALKDLRPAGSGPKGGKVILQDIH